jgi:hypothetical protein
MRSRHVRRSTLTGPRPQRIIPRSRQTSVRVESRWRRVRQPWVWLATVGLGALGFYVSSYIQIFLGSAVPADSAEKIRPPIEVVDVHQVFDDGTDIVVPKDLTEHEFASLDRVDWSTEDWVKEHNAVSIGRSGWEITLEGQRTQEVVVTNMTPTLVEACEEPLDGSMIVDGLSDVGLKYRFDVAIDEPHPVFMMIGDGEPFPYFKQNTIELAKDKKSVFVITVRTSGPYCRWVIDMDYLADGKRNRLTIRAPDGQPFAVTGSLDPRRYQSVYFIPYQECPNRYRRVSGAEYAAIIAGAADRCGK